jgi:hypothetical protein
MKKQGRDHAEWEEIKEDLNVEKDLPTKNDKKWYDLIPLKQIKDMLPRLRYVRGAKDKIQFDGFKITSENNNSIFERNKSYYSSKAQIDRLAWYIGSKMLEIIYTKHGGFSKGKLSEILEAQEEEFKTYDQMKIIKETFADLVKKNLEGYVTEEELEAHASRFLGVFSEKSRCIKVGKILDTLLTDREIYKAKDALRKRVSRNYEAQAAGIKEVKTTSD